MARITAGLYLSISATALRLQTRPAKRWTSIVTAIFLIFIIGNWYGWTKGTCGFDSANCPTQMHQNIAVASSVGFHFDVYMAVVWSLERVMKGNGSVQVYAPSPFPHDFEQIVDRLGLYHGHIKNPTDLISDMANTNISLLIIGTCEFECVHSPLFYYLLLIED